MNANVGKLLLCLSLMSFVPTSDAIAGGVSQGISRADSIDGGAKSDEDGKRQVNNDSPSEADGELEEEAGFGLDGTLTIKSLLEMLFDVELD